jgi:cytochrome c
MEMNKALIWTFIVGFLVSMLYVATAAAEGNPDKGKKGFKKCASCHSIDEGGKNKTGPNLWNIMQRGTAQADFRYSKKFLAWAEENPEWTPELMDAWLTNSKKLVKGTKMNFKEKKEQKRADIIAYLQTMGLTDNE